MKKDKKTLLTIYESNFDFLWAYIYSRIRNKEIASDIVSESFLILFENLENIKFEKAIKNYLFKIAINLMYKEFQREKGIPFDETFSDCVVISNEENSSNSYEKKQKVIKLEQVLSCLSERYSEILRLRYLSNLSINEIAELLNLSIGNVKVLLHRAIAKAKEIVNNLNFDQTNNAKSNI